MNIHKQDTHSVFPRVFQAKGENFLAITILCAFPFDSSGKLLEETDLWSGAGSALGDQGLLDVFLPKDQGEVLAAGKFFSPGGKPVLAGRVRLRIGSVEKHLDVFGNRFWVNKAGVLSIPSAPEPFTQMDISYRNAFGGPDFPRNPLGKGTEKAITPKGDALVPLPNIEFPDRLIGSPSDRPEPAGFGTLGADWQQRAKKLGTYDQKWLNTRWPWFPEDLDWSYFNAAPEDQRIQGYFRGDERVVIENMHPKRPVLESQLPGLRMRCFLQRKKGADEIFAELKTRLDTVWLFPEPETGVLIFRTATPVSDEEASEVRAVFIAHEHLREPEKSVQHYREMFLAPPAAEPVPAETAEPAPPSPVPESPKESDEEKGEISVAEEMDPESRALLEKLKKQLAESEEALRSELKKHGLDYDQLGRDLVPLSVFGPGQVPGAGPELTLEGLGKEMARNEAELNERLKKVGFDPNRPVELPKPAEPAKPQSMKDLIADLRKAGINDPEAEKCLLEMEKEKEEAEKRVAALLEEEKKKQAEREREETARGEEPEKPAEPAIEEKWTREKVIESYRQGQSFAGKDLSGIDLSGLELPRIDLKGTLLEKSDFSGSNLSGADLSGALLTGGLLSKSKLTAAKMAGTDFSGAQAEGADFSNGDLSEADLSQGNFPRANFAGASLKYAVFNHSRLEGASLEKSLASGALFISADLKGVNLREAEITGADFSGAVTSRADFSRTKAHSATFDGAKGEEVLFAGADLRESRADEETSMEKADFQQADLSGANWEGAKLGAAKFRSARMDSADFSRCRLENADLYRATAKQARFTGTDLSGANMVSVNLFRGDLAKARLVKTNLKGANLFEVEFMKAVIRETNFQEANLKRTKLAQWRPA